MRQVGGYARISFGDEDALAIGRQQQDTKTLASLRKWETAPYVDQDISAYQPGVVRPAFEQLLIDLEAGVVGGLVAYDLDRLCRQPSDLERVISIYDRVPGLVFATVQGDIDLSTPDGRTMARVLVAFANKSSMDTARRVARKKLERAMNGHNTSNYRAFGWTDDGKLHPTEAPLLRRVIADILDHELGIYVACEWLNQHSRTVRGNTWKTSALRRVLTAPRIAGLSVYRGELVMGQDGMPVRGQWEPLVDETIWRALDDRLRPRKGTYPERPKKYLLTNILRCGLCGMGMVGFTKDSGKPGYICRGRDSGGCAKVGISGQIEALVIDLVLTYLDNQQVVEDLPGFPAEDRLTEIAGKIAELMDQYREGLSGSIVFPTIKKLEDEQRALQAARSKQVRSRRRVTTVRAEWPDLSLARQQAVLSQLIEAVVVQPAVRAGIFDPSRCQVIWRA